MSRRTLEWLGLVSLMLAPLACRPLPPTGAPGEGNQVSLQPLPSSDMVPAEWGRLVAVTTGAQSAPILWFQDDSANVRVVSFDLNTRRLWPQAGLIRRR